MISLNIAVVGRPKPAGWRSKHGMQFGFIIPLACFVAIMIYGFVWKKLFARDMGNASESPALPTH